MEFISIPAQEENSLKKFRSLEWVKFILTLRVLIGITVNFFKEFAAENVENSANMEIMNRF